MVLRAATKLIQSPNSSTQYVTIPADIVKDSQYPFLANQDVEIRIVPGSRKIEITACDLDEKSINRQR
jgi:hypothetical protein